MCGMICPDSIQNNVLHCISVNLRKISQYQYTEHNSPVLLHNNVVRPAEKAVTLHKSQLPWFCSTPSIIHWCQPRFFCWRLMIAGLHLNSIHPVYLHIHINQSHICLHVLSCFIYLPWHPIPWNPYLIKNLWRSVLKTSVHPESTAFWGKTVPDPMTHRWSKTLSHSAGSEDDISYSLLLWSRESISHDLFLLPVCAIRSVAKYTQLCWTAARVNISGKCKYIFSAEISSLCLVQTVAWCVIPRANHMPIQTSTKQNIPLVLIHFQMDKRFNG